MVLLLLFISILSHIYYLISFAKTHIEKYFHRFLDTTVLNLILGGICIILAIFKPDEIRKIKDPRVVWFMSGLLMILTLAFQISIFIKVSHRSKLPENYHYNFFGKKVHHPSTLKSIEIVLFFSSLPVLLVAGAFFIARLIRFFI